MHKQTGKKHDYKICRKDHLDIPKDGASRYDLGFVVVEKNFPTEQQSYPYLLNMKRIKANGRRMSKTEYCPEEQ